MYSNLSDNVTKAILSVGVMQERNEIQLRQA